MAMTIDEIIEAKLVDAGTVPLPVVAMAQEETERAIRDYCGFGDAEDIPDGLLYVWANMAVDVILGELARRDEQTSGQAVPATVVSSISEGDTSVGYSQVQEKTVAQRADERIKELLSDYKARLRKYRRLSKAVDA